MTLLELQQRYWWLIDDSVTTPRLITAAMITSLVNEARRDIADRLDIITEYDGALNTTLYPSTTGSITLPTTAITTKRFEWGTTTVEPIHNIQLAKTDATTVSQYMFLNRNTVQLYGPTSYEITNAITAKGMIDAMIAVYAATSPVATIYSLVVTAATYANTTESTDSHAVILAAATEAASSGTPASVAAAAVAAASDADSVLVAAAATTESLDTEATALSVVAAAAEYAANVEDATVLSSCLFGYANAAAQEDATIYTTMLGIHSVVSLPKVWLKVYPPALALTTDSPSELPDEYHDFLVSLYVRAKHAAKLGWNNMAQGLMAQWEDIKNELAGKTIDRQWPENYTGDWEW